MSKIMAGAGRVDITPEMGTQIAGAIGMYRPTEEIKAPLFADAVVIRGGGTTMCMVSTPCTSVCARVVGPLRAEIAGLLNTTPGAVMIHGTQSHSAPSIGNNLVFNETSYIPEQYRWLYGGAHDYVGRFKAGILEAVRTALATLQPVTARAGRAVDGGIAFNRRFVFRDGTANMHPGCSWPEILHPEGPADPELSMVALDGADGKAIACLLHFTCHPCHGYGKRWIHPDWPGSWGDGVRGLLGEQCVPVALNGFCGNIHHTDHMHPTQHLEDTIENMTRKLMVATERAVKDLRPVSVETLGVLDRKVMIPWRDVLRNEVEDAQALLKRQPTPPWLEGKEGEEMPWDWLKAIMAIQFAEMRKTSTHYTWELQMFRLGDVAIVACPGEPFVEAQLEIKKKPPVPFVICVHDANDSPGYLPTRKAYEGGGYETANRFKAGGLDIVICHAKSMIQELCGQ